MTSQNRIDISENTLRNRGNVLDILLIDRTRYKTSRPYNIIWATDSYESKGRDYFRTKQIKREFISGTNGNLIQPRAAKSKEEQKYRTKEKAEVFTPLKIVKEMNTAIDKASKNWPINANNWKEYIAELRLEITCGEAPFIASRYNPTANSGVIITPKNRVGFFDHKLQVVSNFVKSKAEWLKYAEIALKATYGYEWQGDNLLIARENILLTIVDFYNDFCITKLKSKSKQNFTNDQLEYFAKIISWNIWQMDGLKYVVPLSCRQITHRKVGVSKDQLSLSLLLSVGSKKVFTECEGCSTGKATVHNGRHAKIMDWFTGKSITFVSLLN